MKLSPQDLEKRLAESYGAKSRPDPSRGRGWCKYDLYGWTIWVSPRGWSCARLTDGRYSDHRYGGDLHHVLEFVCSIQNGDKAWLDDITKRFSMSTW